jgi:hypothetical protein
MTQRESGSDQPRVDTQQSEHERKVAEIEKARGELYAGSDVAEEPGRRPSSDADRGADPGHGDDDDVDDDPVRRRR